MFRRTVTTADGTKYTLGRRWLPRWRQLARVDPGNGPNLPDGGFDDDTGILATIFFAIFAVVAAIFVALVLFNVVAIAIELVLFLFALFAGLFSRVVLRRPWTVYAKSKHMTHERHAVGWRGSRRELRALGEQLTSGREAPTRDRR